MNETTRTASILGIGAVLLAAGIYFLPAQADFTPTSKVNEILFPELKDGNIAQGMEIVSFDEKLGERRTFEVKKVNGRWVLPSHKNYPADARKQLVDVASSLVELKALDQVDDNPEKHELYGVLDPSEDKVKVGTTGVGKLVSFKDGSSNNLARLIIGKQLKELGKESSDSDLRYVRIAGQDPVYTVKLATDKFSPKFEDWIETDLLKLNTFDIKQVELRDYAVRPEDRANPIQEKSIAQLEFDDKEAKWSLSKFEEFPEGKPVEVKLTDKEELNTAKLNELKSALDELKIVNVIRKPQGLINSLRENEIKLETEALLSLQQSGFYLTRGPQGPQLFARDGEVIAALRDGVEYTLRFGDFADGLAESETEGDAKDKEKKTGAKVNRYLMVEARFNPDLIAKPMLEEVPAELPPLPSDGKEEPNKDKQDDKPAEPKSEDSKPAEPNKDEPKADAEKKTEPAKDDKQSSSSNRSPFRTVAFQSPAKEAPDAPAKAAEPKTDDAKKEPAKAQAEEPSKPTSAGEEPKQAETKPADAKLDPGARAEAEFERKRIIRENETKQKDYDTKVKEGQRKAKLLNERFAEWYYVIPDDVYRKIHLGKNDIIQRIKPMPGESTNPLKVPDSLQPGLPPGFPPPGLMPR
jgi:hypothetical protein